MICETHEDFWGPSVEKKEEADTVRRVEDSFRLAEEFFMAEEHEL